jgi:hypothetical protein
MQTRHLFTPPSPFTTQRCICSAVLVASGLMLTGCVADDVDPEGVGGSGGGTAGMGGSGTPGGGGSSGNAPGGGGSSGATGGITSDPDFGRKIPCASPTQPLILDFSAAAPAPGDAGVDGGGADASAPGPTGDAAINGSFGNFGTEFSGGTYRYPADGAWPVGSDVTQGNWQMSGDIGTYSGFGLYFGGTVPPSTEACNIVDLSMYDGISFTISGSVGTLNTLTMSVAIAANNASHIYLNTVAMPPPATPATVNSGRCIPPGPNQFDGTCAAPSAAIAVTTTPTTVTMLWSDFTMGRPAAAVDPAEITGIAWAFPPPPGVGGEMLMTYPIDLVIDDIRFVDNP